MDQIERVLVVEDDQGDAHLARVKIESHFHNAKVHVARTLQETLTSLGEQPFDIVLLDLSLPDATGFAAIDGVCAASDVPVIILTEMDHEELAMAAMCRGAHEYLIKGSGDSRALAIAMRHAVYRSRAQREIYKLNTALELSIQERTQELLEATQREQRRLGRDLHDGIQGGLVVMTLLLGALGENLRKSGPAAAKFAREVEAIQKVAKDALVQTRALARGLCPADLKSAGLGKALALLADTTSSVFRIPCEFKCDPSAGIDDESAATQLYYIGLEALNNAVKHSGGQKIEISLSQDDDALTLAILDDGVGISTDTCTMTSMGLRTMSYRAKLIGASLEVRRGPKAGTIARCRLPMRYVSDKSNAEC